MNKLIARFLVATTLLFAGIANALPADLGKTRNWSVDPTSLLRMMITDKYEPEGGGSSTASGLGFAFEFGRNYGGYEFGPIFTYMTVKDSSYTVKTLDYGIYGRVNFADNRMGVKQVPFARASLVLGKSDYDSDGGTDYTVTKNLLSLGGGVSLFPFNSDHISFEGALYYKQRSYDSDRLTDYKLTGFFLDGTFRLYF